MYKTKLHKATFLLSSIFLLLFFFSCGGNSGDTDIQENVTEEIKDMQGYGAVHAVVRDRIVFLTGQCEGSGCARQLEERIRKVKGVIAVENDVTEGVSPNR